MSTSPALDAALRATEAGRLVPYLGPGVVALGGGVPASPEALAGLIEAAVRVPRRASGNLWAAAQFVETRRHRKTVAGIVERAFAAPAGGNSLQRWLATVRPSLVVDAWYDRGLIEAYQTATPPVGTWGWVQAVSRHEAKGEAFFRACNSDGAPRPEGPDPAWASLIYKPHGLIGRGSSFLISDSDYVQVLTEIDIQTPIPAEVQSRRAERGFLFLGCRFDDQLLRSFARQIIKRSKGPHLAVVTSPLTRMEQRFLEAEEIEQLDLPIDAVVSALEARTQPEPA